MITNIVNGVESIEFAPITNGVVGAWTRIEDIEDGSVSLTSNNDTKTNIIPEDKDSPIISLFTPGDPDVFNFAMLQVSPDNLALFANVEYDIATTTSTVLDKKKHANLAIRLTTRPQLGFKKRFTYNNTLSDITYKNNITKNGLLAIAVAASLLSWKTATNKDATYTVETLLEDGSVLNSTLPTVAAPADTTSTSATKSLVGTASAASPKTLASTLWSQVSGPNTAGFSAPTALTTNATGLITGTYVFRLTATDSQGIVAYDDVTVVVTIA